MKNNWSGYICTILLGVGYYPQIWKLYRTHDAHSISSMYWWAVLAGLLAGMHHMWKHKDKVMFWSFVHGAACAGAILVACYLFP